MEELKTETSGNLQLDGVRVDNVISLIESAGNIHAIAEELLDEASKAVGADRMVVYQRSMDDVLVPLLGLYEDITLPIDTSSIPGYVAMTGEPLSVDDVYDIRSLRRIHPELMFEYVVDQVTGYISEAMIATPVMFNNVLVGVLQFTNKVGAHTFTGSDFDSAKAITEAVTNRFFYDISCAPGPFAGLVSQGRITIPQLEELKSTAEERGRSVTSLLGAAGIEEVEIRNCLEDYYNVPYMAYDEDAEPEMNIVNQLRAEFLSANRWVPFPGEDGEVVILIDDPHDSERLLEIEQLVIADSFSIRVGTVEVILRYLNGGEEESQESANEFADLFSDATASASRISDEAEQKVDITDTEDTSGIVQFVNRMIVKAVEDGASDIHINPGKDGPGRVRYRVDGVCREIMEIPPGIYSNIVARIKVLSKLDISEKRKPQDGKIAVTMDGSALELRVATVPTVLGESAILRVLAAGDPLAFDQLNFTSRNIGIIKRGLEHPHGIILVVGPTGSGKTTTLHGLLGYLNTPERNIMTAEDPVEITQPGLQQVQMQAKQGLTFAAALRSFLRADPDVILIGEMRDHETCHAGMEAALTGHLVFSTLHTNSAPETITRLLDMGLDPLNFSDALVTVLAQRLLRTLCKNCKTEYKADAADIEKLKHAYKEEFWSELRVKEDNLKLSKPAGCTRCANTGYRGRTGIHEVIEATDAMKSLIANKAPVAELRATAMKESMRTLTQDGVTKILRGQADYTQLRKVTVD